jgi:hypothetical protein
MLSPSERLFPKHIGMHRPAWHRRILPALGLALACVAAPALAERMGQTGFLSRKLGSELQLDYAWVDLTGAHKTGFRVQSAALSAARQGFRAYRRSDLQTAADDELRRQIERAVEDLKRAHPGLSISVDRDLSIHSEISAPADFEQRQREIFGEELTREIAAIESEFPGASIRRDGAGSIELQARSNRDLAAIEQRLQAAQTHANAAVASYADEANARSQYRAERVGQEIRAEIGAIEGRMQTFRNAYFRERLYRLDDSGALLPDYARIGERAVPALASAAAALAAAGHGHGPREVLSLALGFVQTIPYERLDNRAEDAGFLPPLVMLAENRGDCDTKSVAFAALARRLYPEIPSLLILLPTHALLGLGIAPAPGDRTVRYGNRDWVLAEPVGPAVLPLGEVGEDSRGDLSRPKAAIKLFP